MKTKITLLAVLTAILLLPAVRAEDDSENIWEKRVATTVDSIVFVKFVMKIQMTRDGQSQEVDQNREVLGAVMNDQGLIMSSNTNFEPAVSLPANLRQRVQVQGTPTDLKVLFGNEEQEYESQLVARDSLLDLAFVQILDLKGRQVKPIDLKTSVEPKLGQRLFGVARMGRGFDCVPAVVELFISSCLTKPRKMWAASGELPSPALPVFTMNGVIAGIVSLQEASAGVGGAGGRRRPFIVPVADVLKSLEMAAERATEALAAAAEDGDAPEKTEGTDEAKDPEDAGEGE